MALTVTLLDLRTQVKERASMENGGPLTNAEFNRLINASVRKLYRMLAQAFGAEYFAKNTALVTAPLSATPELVALPSDFFKLVSLWWNDNSGTLKRIRKAQEDELEMFFGGSGWSSLWSNGLEECGVKYAIRAASLRFAPIPTAVHSLKLNYIAAPVTLSSDASTLDGYGGFEEYVIWDATAAALAKENSDNGDAKQERDMIAADILATADRDQGEPWCIQDTNNWMGE
jgi:hypothetical protein